MPPGYSFLKRGNQYLTKHGRQSAYEASRPVYVVKDGKKCVLGIRIPSEILRGVLQSEQKTRGGRKQVMDRKDEREKRKFEEELLQHFPCVPRDLIPGIVEHTLKKRSRRVGRTSKMGMREKVTLAVAAHVRHRRTDYDKLLREGMPRDEARKHVCEPQNKILKQWAGIGKVPSRGPRKAAAVALWSSSSSAHTKTQPDVAALKTRPATNKVLKKKKKKEKKKKNQTRLAKKKDANDNTIAPIAQRHTSKHAPAASPITSTRVPTRLTRAPSPSSWATFSSSTSLDDL